MPKIKITPEWRLLDPRVDLDALGRYLDTVEHQLALLQDQWKARLTADLTDAPEDSDWLWHEFEMTEAHVTRSLRGGFIMSLWASYESGILEVADFLQKKKNPSPQPLGCSWSRSVRPDPEVFRQRTNIPSPSRPTGLELSPRVTWCS